MWLGSLGDLEHIVSCNIFSFSLSKQGNLGLFNWCGDAFSISLLLLKLTKKEASFKEERKCHILAPNESTEKEIIQYKGIRNEEIS